MSSKSDIAVSVRGLSKAYTIAHECEKHVTLAEQMLSRIRRPFQRTPKETFWALKDVEFDIKKGDVVGIIGRNGAGKSTLLKVLSRITEPTEGEIRLYGRVGSLLEVGTGFHPELTGRENIYLNGQILGMRKKEIEKQFDAIVDFAGVEKFIDTPVKRYSSGMGVRLAFAVAAHLESEILLVDEVLAVGDFQFQRKCLGKLDEVSRDGRTVVFVSHDTRALRSLCREGIYLRKGAVSMQGGIDNVVKQYLADADSQSADLPIRADGVVAHGFSIVQDGQKTSTVEGSTSFSVELDFEVLQDTTLFRIGIYLNRALGDAVFRSFTSDWDPDRENLAAGRYQASLQVPGNLLMPGAYKVGLHASRFGIEGLISENEVQHDLFVTAPTRFNEAHPSEPIDAPIILEQGWELKRSDSLDHQYQTCRPIDAA